MNGRFFSRIISCNCKRNSEYLAPSTQRQQKKEGNVIATEGRSLSEDPLTPLGMKGLWPVP